jgi:hypothetical protein
MRKKISSSAHIQLKSRQNSSRYLLVNRPYKLSVLDLSNYSSAGHIILTHVYHSTKAVGIHTQGFWPLRFALI